MIRTTIGFDPELLRDLKSRAAEQGRTLQDLVGDLVRQALSTRSPAEPFRLELDAWHGEVPHGVDLADRDALFDPFASRR